MFEEKCDTTHGMTALSITSASVCGLLLVLTVPFNGLILVCLCKNVASNRAKYKLFFYKIIINIALADLAKVKIFVLFFKSLYLNFLIILIVKFLQTLINTQIIQPFKCFNCWVRGLIFSHVGFEFRDRSSILIVSQITDRRPQAPRLHCNIA